MIKVEHDDWLADIKEAMKKFPYDVLIKVSGHQWKEIFQTITRREHLLRLQANMGEDGHVNVNPDSLLDVRIYRVLHVLVARLDVVTDVIAPWVKEVSSGNNEVTIMVLEKPKQEVVATKIV